MATSLKVLQQAVIASLEGGRKGSVAPVFHRAVDLLESSGRDDLEPAQVQFLREELGKIADALARGLALNRRTVTVEVPVHDTGYSPLLGVPVEKDAEQTVFLALMAFIEQCEAALILECGLGKHSASSERVKEAFRALQLRPEVFQVVLDGQRVELRMFTFDSNNNPQHRMLVDGMWAPYESIGIVRTNDGSITLGFRAKMDYGSGRWQIERCDTAYLPELAAKSSLFADAYRKVAGVIYDAARVVEVLDATSKQLVASPEFQQMLQRTCSRWLMI